MESMVVCLALESVLRGLNWKKTNLFLDELSGVLNNGKNLSYSAMNFHDLFIKLIHKISKKEKIFIIDHNLDFGENVGVLEVQPGKEGSVVKKLI